MATVVLTNEAGQTIRFRGPAPDAARRLETQIVSENPEFSRDDVRIVRTEGGQLRPELTSTGHRQRRELEEERAREQIAEQMSEQTGTEVDPDDVQVTDVWTGEERRWVGRLTPEARRRIEREQGVQDASAEVRVTDDAGPQERPRPDTGERRLFPEGTETETIGAAGPMGVTVPADRDPGVDLAAGAQSVAAWVTSRPRQEATDPDAPGTAPEGAPRAGNLVTVDAEDPSGGAQRRERFISDLSGVAGAVVTEPAGPPGPGVPSGQGTDPQADVDAVSAFAGDVAEQLTTVPQGEAPPADVPEGAPGAGNLVTVDADDPQGGAERRERFARDVDRVATQLGTVPEGEAPPAEVPEGAPGAGNLVTTQAPGEEGVAREQHERFARDVGRAVGGVALAGAAAVTTEPEGPPGTGNLVTTDQPVGLDVDEQREIVAERITAGGAAVSQPFEDAHRRRQQRETVVVSEEVGAWVDDVVVTEEEAARMDPLNEQFGDADWVVAGIDVEQTAERSSQGFRSRTSNFSEGATDRLGLEEGSGGDVATETFLTTTPEIVNVGGLTRDAMEIAELGGFVAADPRDHSREVAVAGRQTADALAHHFWENPAEAIGTGAALAVQWPASLGVLRGVSSVSRTGGRALDVAWNTPERVAKRTIGRSDTDPLAEVRALRGDLQRSARAESETARAAAESRQAVRAREAGLTERSMLREDVELYNAVPGLNRVVENARDTVNRVRVEPRAGAGFVPPRLGVRPRRVETEADVDDLPTEIAGTDPDDVRPGRFGREPPRSVGERSAIERRRQRRIREAEEDEFDAWRERREQALVSETARQRQAAAGRRSTRRPRRGLDERLLTAEANAGVVQGERQRTEQAAQPFWMGGEEIEAQATGADVLTADSEATTAGAGLLVTGLAMEGLGTDFRAEAETMARSEVDQLGRLGQETETRLGVETDQELEQELEQEFEQETETEQEVEQEQELEREMEPEPEPEFEFEPEPALPDVRPDAPPERRREEPDVWGQTITNLIPTEAGLFGIRIQEPTSGAGATDQESDAAESIEILSEPDRRERDDQPAITVQEPGEIDDALDAFASGIQATSGRGDATAAAVSEAFLGGAGAGADGAAGSEQPNRRSGAPGARRANPMAAAARRFGQPAHGQGGQSAGTQSPGRQHQDAAAALRAQAAQMQAQARNVATGASAPPQGSQQAGADLGPIMGGMARWMEQSASQQQSQQRGGPDVGAALRRFMGGGSGGAGGRVGQDVELVPEFDFDFDFGLGR